MHYIFLHLQEGEISADLFTFHEAVSQLQLLEDEVLDSHSNLVEVGPHWLELDQALLTMTHDVDYDQDGESNNNQNYSASKQLHGSKPQTYLKLPSSKTKTGQVSPSAKNPVRQRRSVSVPERKNVWKPSLPHGKSHSFRESSSGGSNNSQNRRGMTHVLDVTYSVSNHQSDVNSEELNYSKSKDVRNIRKQYFPRKLWTVNLDENSDVHSLSNKGEASTFELRKSSERGVKSDNSQSTGACSPLPEKLWTVDLDGKSNIDENYDSILNNQRAKFTNSSVSYSEVSSGLEYGSSVANNLLKLNANASTGMLKSHTSIPKIARNLFPRKHHKISNFSHANNISATNIKYSNKNHAIGEIETRLSKSYNLSAERKHWNKRELNSEARISPFGDVNIPFEVTPSNCDDTNARKRSLALVKRRLILKKLVRSKNPAKSTPNRQKNEFDSTTHEAAKFRFSSLVVFAVLPFLYFVFFLVLSNFSQ